MRLIAIALLLVSHPHSAIAEDALNLHNEVLATYSFQPHLLDAAALQAKSKVLDSFWARVKDGGADGLAALRSELQRTDLPAFFNYDGAKLLLSLSTASADRQLALEAIPRANLLDLQSSDYLYTIHRFAVDEFDTSEAAFKILSDPAFKVFVPQHVLTLEHDYCLLYLLLPTREEFYLDKAIARLDQETNDTAFKSLLHLIAATVTTKGDAAIARYADGEAHPKALRETAATVRNSLKAMADVPLLGMSLHSYTSLKNEQRKIMARISDEALYDLDRNELELRQKGAR
jgi:hypothetical protein